MNYKEGWKEYRATYTKEAQTIISSMTLEEKVRLMSGSLTLDDILSSIRKKSRTHYNEVPYVAGGIKDVPAVKFVDGTRGVVCGNGTYTCFPVASMRGATFNKELEKEVGRAIGEEVILADGNLFGGVCLNVPYHPGWGRAQETYGEDTTHISKMGATLIEGVQSTGVMACVKHFAFNSMENIRREVDVTCDNNAEEEIFLKQFRAAIDTGAAAVMTSYNSYKGEKCGQNEYLIHQTLREKWGFDGFTLCDFTWGITDTLKAINAGLDIEMPNTNYYGQKLLDLIHEHAVSEEKIDESVLRIVRTVLAHEKRIDLYKQKLLNKVKILEEHRGLAKKVAVEGITLLKNEGVLPIKCRESKSRLVVLGRLAEQPNTGDRGSSQVYPPYVVTPLQGIINNCGKAEVVYYGGNNANHCIRLVKDAKAVIIVVGNDYGSEGERISADFNDQFKVPGGDRTEGLGISKEDLELIRTVSTVRKDAIVLLEGGSTIVVDDFIDSIGALLFCYYPGMEGGNAIGEIIFGKSNPSGKLPFVIPRKESDLQEMDWTNTQQHYDYYHGYTLLEKNNIEPRFSHGFGLSYTTFSLERKEIEKVDDSVVIIATVANTGNFYGAEVVKVYAKKSWGKELIDFDKVSLKPQESKKVTFKLPWNESVDYYVEI